MFLKAGVWAEKNRHRTPADEQSNGQFRNLLISDQHHIRVIAAGATQFLKNLPKILRFFTSWKKLLRKAKTVKSWSFPKFRQFCLLFGYRGFFTVGW
jgi:hypothetical protein